MESSETLLGTTSVWTESINVSTQRSLTQEEADRYIMELSAESFVHRLPMVMYLISVSVVGFFGNVLVLAVYLLRFKPSATRSFVLGIATCDLLTCIVGLPIHVATIRHAYSTAYSYVFCRGMFAAVTLPTQASGMILVVVALERYFRVCRNKTMTAQVATRLVIGGSVAAIVIFAPFVPLYGRFEVQTPVEGLSVSMCWIDDEYHGTAYESAYGIVVLITFAVGLLTMIFAYTMIGRRVWKQHRRVVRKAPVASSSSCTDPTSVTPGQPPARQLTDVEGQRLTPETSVDSGHATSPPESEFLPGNDQGLSNKEAPKDDEANGTAKSSTLKLKRMSMKLGKGSEARSAVHQQNPGAGPGTQSRERVYERVTLMMAVLTVLYAANWLPHLVTRFVRHDPVNLCDNFIDCGSSNAYAFTLRSFYINSAVNAFVYSFCSINFREQCLMLFRCKMEGESSLA